MSRAARGTSDKKPVERFRLTSQAEILDLFPNQWLAIAVEEVNRQCGVAGGYIIARGRNDKTVFAKLLKFRRENPDQHVAFLYTGRYIKHGRDVM